jgi:hypothetical protein
MTRAIECNLGRPHGRHGAVGDQNSLALHRAGDHLAQRIDDRAIAGTIVREKIAVLLRDGAPAQDRPNAHHEGTGLCRKGAREQMLARRFRVGPARPWRLAAGPACHMHLAALLGERIGRQHHLVLGAGQTTQATIRAIMHPKLDGIAVGPDRSLMRCRLELPMAAEDLPLGADEQQRRVGRAARVGVALRHADRHVDHFLPRDRAERIGGRTWNLD